MTLRARALHAQLEDRLDAAAARSRALLALPVGAERDMACPDCHRPTQVLRKVNGGWRFVRLYGSADAQRMDFRCAECAPEVTMTRRR